VELLRLRSLLAFVACAALFLTGCQKPQSKENDPAKNEDNKLNQPAPAKVAKTEAPAPPPRPTPDHFTLALQDLHELQRTNNEEAQIRMGKKLAEHASKLTDGKCGRIIESVAALGKVGKPASRFLCEIIANRDVALQRSALAALEAVNPDLYEPMVTIRLDRSASSHFISLAVDKIASLKDRAAVPVLLHELRTGLRSAEESRRFYILPSVAVRYVTALVEIAPDEEPTFEVIFAITKAWANNKNVRNFRYDNEPVAIAAVQVLSTFGGRARVALPALKQLKLDEERKMREAAAEAVRRIEGSE